MENLPINHQYKDRLFKIIFADKEQAIELYRAVSGDDRSSDDSDFEFTTLQDVIYLSMKNDLSFCCFNTLSLFEQQSTYNANMPLRGLLYFARVLQGYASRHHLNLYSNAAKPQSIPTPRFFVIYCGQPDEPAISEMKLSEACKNGLGDVEVFAHMYNICAMEDDQIEKILSKSETLYGYAFFCSTMKQQLKSGKAVEDAVELAFAECRKRNILKEVLEQHRAEVKDAVLTEYNEAEQLRLEHEEGRAEGKAEGITEGRAEGRAEGKAEGIVEGEMSATMAALKNLMQTMNLTAMEAMDALLIPDAKRQEFLPLLVER